MSSNPTETPSLTDLQEAPSVRVRPLVSRSLLRRLLLDTSAGQRHHTFTRVDPECYAAADAVVRAWANRIVAAQPSSGKTIRPA